MFQGIKLQETIKVCGLLTQLSNSQQKNYELIRVLWQRFNRELSAKQVRLGKNWRKYGVVFKANEVYFYLAAIDCVEDLNEFEKIELQGGAYAGFKHQGAMYQLKDFYYNLYKKLIPNLDLNIDSNRKIIHYELYNNQFNWNHENSVIEIFVPLQGINDLEIKTI